jgi:hypothetical protein
MKKEKPRIIVVVPGKWVHRRERGKKKKKLTRSYLYILLPILIGKRSIFFCLLNYRGAKSSFNRSITKKN